MSKQKKIIILLVISITLLSLYLFVGLEGNINYILQRRIVKVVTLILVASALAYATLIFQTLTNNHLLTPSILGVETLFVFIQTVIVFSLGSFIKLPPNQNYVIQLVIMIIVSLLLYVPLVLNGKQFYLILLCGLLITTFFDSITTFMQVVMDPNAFLVVQTRVNASFNRIDETSLVIAIIIMGATMLYAIKYTRVLDILLLGKEHAMALGVNYKKTVYQLMTVVIILTASSTMLVGPLTFLGFIVVNISYKLMKTYQHRYLIISSILIGIIGLSSALYIIERFTHYGIPMNAMISLIGGTYFMYILIKEGRT